MYKIIIRDAELNSKLNPSLTESLSKHQNIAEIQRFVEANTGLKVFCRLNEQDNTVEVKRLLIG